MKLTTMGARAIYDFLVTDRDPFLRRAQKVARFTLPLLVPPDGHTPASDIVDPEQSIGGRGVNHLAAKLLLVLLTPNAPFFRLVPDGIGKEALSQDKEQQAKTEAALARFEQEAQREAESQAYRVPAVELFKHLIVSGNGLMHIRDNGAMDFYPLSKYVTKRDGDGRLIAIVIKECFAPETLPEDVYAVYMGAGGNSESGAPGSTSGGRSVEVYTRIVRKNEKRFLVYQEVLGQEIPGTRGEYNEDSLPFVPLRWTKVHGEDYGRGHVEDYLGDLETLERLTRALSTGALASARLIFGVDPNSATDPKDLSNAANGEFVSMSPDSVYALQAGKFADFRVAFEQATAIQKRLEAAFLLNVSATRQAERVTAEEIRFVGQELEAALGGVYSTLSQEFQLPLARAILQNLQTRKIIPRFTALQKKHIKPVIVTGVDALGRMQELDRVRAIFGTMQGVIGPEQVAQAVNVERLVEFLFTSGGVRIEGLMKSPEERAAEQQQRQMMAALQEMLSKGTGPVAGAMAKNAVQPPEAPQ